MKIVSKIILYPIHKLYFLIRKNRDNNYGVGVLNQEETNDIITALLKKDESFMISRLGSEINIINIYKQKNRNFLNRYWQYIKTGVLDNYTERIKCLISYNAGIFPANDNILDKFSEITLNAIRNIDVLGIWRFLPQEKELLKEYCSNAKLIEAKYTEPYYHNNPWTKELKGKRVLVIHPFTESIKNQYGKRELLFEDKDTLPEFELLTIKAVQSIAGNEVDFNSWVEALDYMKSEINKLDFDVALIGAGAYGLPLASHVKEIGKQAIHIGGAIQILFGIKGQRWDDHPIISKFYNDHWVRPLTTETPSKSNNVENGCYW